MHNKSRKDKKEMKKTLIQKIADKRGYNSVVWQELHFGLREYQRKLLRAMPKRKTEWNENMHIKNFDYNECLKEIKAIIRNK